MTDHDQLSDPNGSLFLITDNVSDCFEYLILESKVHSIIGLNYNSYNSVSLQISGMVLLAPDPCEDKSFSLE